MLPALESLLEAFPLRILRLRADNGPGYINHQVVRPLEKLRVAEFTNVPPAAHQ